MLVYEEHFCAAVVHPDTGKTIINYKVLVNDKGNPKLRETRRTAFGKEVHRAFGTRRQ